MVAHVEFSKSVTDGPAVKARNDLARIEVDAIVERLYRKMQDFDARRAQNTVGLIVDRDAAAESVFKALLDDLRPCRRASEVAA
jgi:hypothetical protein